MRRRRAIRRSRKTLDNRANEEIDKCDDVSSECSVSVEVTAKKHGRKRKRIVSSSEEDDEAGLDGENDGFVENQNSSEIEMPLSNLIIIK
ncbi:hypothetical protein A2U01_0072297, partial [Trifolium medium]|nr:hypothetical protein [Trifolium medium]